MDLHFAADDRWRWLPWRANCTCGGHCCREMTRQERARRRFAAAVGLTEEEPQLVAAPAACANRRREVGRAVVTR